MPVQKGPILAQRTRRVGPLPQLGFAAALVFLPALTVLTAFGIAPGTAIDPEPQHLVREAVPLPDLAPTAALPQKFVAQDKVLRGDTVGALLERLGVRDGKALDFMRGDATGRLIFRQLVPGRILQAEMDADGDLVSYHRVKRYTRGRGDDD